MSDLDAALGAVDADALARDLSALVQEPSLTGDERGAMERFAEMAAALGLESEVVEHDLAALRAAAAYPGEEAPRTELVGAVAILPGDPDLPRVCLDGHLDVVGPGTEAWSRDPFSGAIDGGYVHGRGSVDMKGGVVAALHALGALRASGMRTGEVVLYAVASEEDGGLGTFAALERDDRFDAALIPEPTDLALVCAQAGALTFEGRVPGRSAHAAFRLAGASALDRYVRVHEALAEHERRINHDVEHPRMRELPLPYPLLVGRIASGSWSSQVPDLLTFEGRVGVRVGETPEAARAVFEQVVREASDDGEAPIELTWAGGQFASGETPGDHPWVQRAARALEAERGVPSRLAGVPYGADMRLFTARGIPCLMLGTRGTQMAHAIDERVEIDDLALIARTIVRILAPSLA